MISDLSSKLSQVIEQISKDFLKRCKKLMNAEELKEPRLGMFKDLLVLNEKIKEKISMSNLQLVHL